MGGAVLLSARQDILSMKTRGAGEIGRRAALALAEAAQGFPSSTIEAFRADLLAAARMLAESRPTAVSLRNALNVVLTAAMKEAVVAPAKVAALRSATEFSAKVDTAKVRIAKTGAELLSTGDVILTHCHSSVAGALLVQAHKQGKKIRAFVTETRPFRQGLITSRALRDGGVPVTLIVDSAALHVMESERVTKVVIGADTVAADGSLYNKIGTRMVTLAAKALGIPVLVAAESFKFSPYTLEGADVSVEEREAAEVVDPAQVPGVKILNPVFDRTPPDQVTKYVTEDGILRPDEVGAYIQKTYGGKQRWI